MEIPFLDHTIYKLIYSEFLLLGIGESPIVNKNKQFDQFVKNDDIVGLFEDKVFDFSTLLRRIESKGGFSCYIKSMD